MMAAAHNLYIVLYYIKNLHLYLNYTLLCLYLCINLSQPNALNKFYLDKG